jgi:hypothetical protein
MFRIRVASAKPNRRQLRVRIDVILPQSSPISTIKIENLLPSPYTGSAEHSPNFRGG